MTNIPNDPMMLLSFLNMKLRDFYPDLNALCQDLELDKDAIVDKLAAIDYHYDESLNRFA